MGKFKIMMILLICKLMLFLIPIIVIGAIVENPLGFLGDKIISIGDTKEVNQEVKEMYNEFLKSDIGKKTVEYINKKSEGKEKKYSNSYFIIPVLLSIGENNIIENNSFEKLEIKKKIDILFEIKYNNEQDDFFSEK